ncbi:MAG TPA: hypothetical protein DCZ75_16365 [Geobacter sp.]|nr:hypothetical protein [Geobacter sp.]
MSLIRIFFFHVGTAAGRRFPARLQGVVRPLAALLVLVCLLLSEATAAPAPADATGSELFRQGRFGAAGKSFEAAVDSYREAGDKPRQCQALIQLAQACYFTGQHRRALGYLQQAASLANELGDRRLLAAVRGNTGNVHLAMGALDLAEATLKQALATANGGEGGETTASILNNLGNLYLARKSYPAALEQYRESAALAGKAGNVLLAAQAQVNGATAARRAGRDDEARSLAEKAVASLAGAGDSYAKAYSLISAGELFRDLRSSSTDRRSPVQQSYDAFNDAVKVARHTDDQRTLSYAYGNLGKLYEDEHRYDEALELTRQAIFAAQKLNVAEALYRWQWQRGRILARMERLDEAIAAYRLSLQDLQAIREEMSSCYASPDSTYQKTAGVVCFELVDLLLQRASRLKDDRMIEPYLVEARETLETLKVFELREYFRDDCIDAARSVEKKLDLVSEKAVVVYPVLLPDRVELLVSFGSRLKRFTLPVGVDELTGEVREFRRKLVKRTTWEFLPHAQKLYDWLIRPLEKDLDSMQIDTLVFVPDGALRTIPMAALHDGNRFLIDRYPIAITPGLSLTDPKPVRREQARLLSVGLTEAVQGFPGLPYVVDEMRSIKELYGGNQLLNGQFRLTDLEKELKREPFSMVHIASHGQFGGDVANTFLLAFDEKFTIDRFGEYVGLFKFREEPLDLLTLSACETAAGDDRAALGLAGVAVRSGARSALATLWHVNDPAAYELVTEFYQRLKVPGTSRAFALQAAQRKLLGDLRYDHPAYWAPFLLINNWL